LIHDTINHSKEYKNPATQVHTNTMEVTNNILKIMTRPSNWGNTLECASPLVSQFNKFGLFIVLS
jgi:hypothetical protein